MRYPRPTRKGGGKDLEEYDFDDEGDEDGGAMTRSRGDSHVLGEGGGCS